MKYSSFALLLILTIPNIKANPIESGICSAYFASIKAKKANLHIGPGKEYKIVICYVFKTFPVMVIAKYDHWRKIVDVDGTEGWIHKNMLSKNRYVIVKDKITSLHKEAKINSTCIANIKKNVIPELISVNDSWCNIKIKYEGLTYKGWIQKKTVFGTLPNETSR